MHQWSGVGGRIKSVEQGGQQGQAGQHGKRYMPGDDPQRQQQQSAKQHEDGRGFTQAAGRGADEARQLIENGRQCAVDGDSTAEFGFYMTQGRCAVLSLLAILFVLVGS